VYTFTLVNIFSTNPITGTVFAIHNLSIGIANKLTMVLGYNNQVCYPFP